MNLASIPPDRIGRGVAARGAHLVGGCVAMATLVAATLPWSDGVAPEPARAAVQHAVAMKATPSLLAPPGAATPGTYAPAASDLDTVAASIASYDR